MDANKSIAISIEIHDSFLETMECYNKEVSEHYAEDSFPRLFWQQQMKAASVKDTRAMRWHPLQVVPLLAAQVKWSI